MACGNGRNAKIDLLAPHRVRNAPILRQPTFGDVERGHQFDTTDDGVAQRGRRRLARTQATVNPETNREAVGRWLHVNIGCALVHGARKQRVYEANDRRVARRFAQLVELR
jgi:hypothetical protein